MNIGELNLAIAKALGIPTDKLVSLSLRLEANSLPRVTAEYLVFSELGEMPQCVAKEFTVDPVDGIEQYHEKRLKDCPPKFENNKFDQKAHEDFLRKL